MLRHHGLLSVSQVRPAIHFAFRRILFSSSIHCSTFASQHNQTQDMSGDGKPLDYEAFDAHRKIVGYPDGGLENPPVLVFDPSSFSKMSRSSNEKFTYPRLSDVTRPSNNEDLTFMSIVELGSLLRTKQITSVELVKIFTDHLKRADHVLKAVVTYMDKLALEQASAADKLLADGIELGPLHGIPYGLKDIIAVPGYSTTWGCKTFKDQVIDKEALVYKRLKEAGAVLIAKLVTGSLAYDDIWFGGRTRNPWNTEDFSTGSSAGPAVSVSSGSVAFAIGSETSGSITSPASKAGITAFKPTFGMVGRSGVMSLSESLDKIGPFGRCVADCAIILDVLRGKDPDDLSSKAIALRDPFAIDISKMTVGYCPDAQDEVVQVLSSNGARVVPFDLRYTVKTAQAIVYLTMDVDTLSHFDNWQRAGLDAEYEAQHQWPEELSRARQVSAVDYLQAQRVRGKLIREVLQCMEGIDAFISSPVDWEKVAVSNLVGMPVLVLPTGFQKPKNDSDCSCATTTAIYAAPYKDSEVLALGMAYQRATYHHRQHPPVCQLHKR